MSSLDDILDKHLQDIRAGHDEKLKQALIQYFYEVADGIMPKKYKGLDKAFKLGKIDWHQREKYSFYNDAIDDMRQRLAEWKEEKK
jgi:hypothetical protein